MVIHKISIVGGVAGASIIICSIIRWFFLYYDPSQMILSVSIGLIVCVFSYLYNWMKMQQQVVGKINKRIDAFTAWMGKKELE